MHPFLVSSDGFYTICSQIKETLKMEIDLLLVHLKKIFDCGHSGMI